MWCATAALLLAVAGEVKIQPVPADAVYRAVADVAALAEHERKFIRYVWTDGREDSIAAVQMTVNTAISRSRLPIRCWVSADGRLIRIDLTKLRPKDEDLAEAIKLWEKQAAKDTTFYQEVMKKVAPYRAVDGKQYDYVWVPAFGVWTGEYDLEGEKFDLTKCALLQGMTGSAVPIQSAEFFVTKTLTQNNGGQYYAWAGVRKSQKAGVTDFQQLLLDHGIDVKVAEQQSASRRLALKISDVTQQPRAIQIERSYAGAATWSEDVAKGNRDPKSDPFKELENPKKDAIEAIFTRPNGFCTFAIYDGKEALVDVVPDVIAKDTTQPPGFGILEPASSCIRCHAIGKGYRSTRNDFAKLLKSREKNGVRFDLLGSVDEKDQREFIDRISAKYQVDMTRFVEARNTYSTAVFLATSGKSVQFASGGIQRLDNKFRFDRVTAKRICDELGFDVEEKDSLSLLQSCLAPETAPGGQEDDNIAAIRNGIPVTADTWNAIKSDALLRSRPYYYRAARKIAEQGEAAP